MDLNWHLSLRSYLWYRSNDMTVGRMSKAAVVELWFLDLQHQHGLKIVLNADSWALSQTFWAGNPRGGPRRFWYPPWGAWRAWASVRAWDIKICASAVSQGLRPTCSQLWGALLHQGSFHKFGSECELAPCCGQVVFLAVSWALLFSCDMPKDRRWMFRWLTHQIGI